MQKIFVLNKHSRVKLSSSWHSWLVLQGIKVTESGVCKRNSSQVLLTAVNSAIQTFDSQFQIKLRQRKLLLHKATHHCLTPDLLCWCSLNQNELGCLKQFYVSANSIPGLKHGNTLRSTLLNTINVTSNTPLFCLDTSFCLHSYLLVCSFNHRPNAKKWWINDKLLEEESTPYPVFFSIKSYLKEARDTQIFQLVHIQACLSERTSLRIEMFSYYYTQTQKKLV